MPRIRTWLEEYVVRAGPELVAAIEDERGAHLAAVLEELETRTVSVAEAESRIEQLERRLAAVGAKGETHQKVERLLVELAERDVRVASAERRLTEQAQQLAAAQAKLARRERELEEILREAGQAPARR